MSERANQVETDHPRPITSPSKRRQRRVVDVPEVAEVLGFSLKATYKLIAAGQVPGVLRLGRRIVISKTALDRWLAGA